MASRSTVTPLVSFSPEAVTGGNEFETYARVRTLHGPSVCPHKSGVAPYIVTRGRPRMGRLFTMTVMVEALRSADGAIDERDVWLVLSPKPLPEPVSFNDFGMPGCWAHLPIRNVVFFPARQRTKVGHWLREQNSPVVRFAWDVPDAPEWAGRTLCVQAVVHSPGVNPSNLAASHAVVLTVGR